MNKIIAACGLICSDCPAYIATFHDDPEMRKKTAEEWSKAYGAEIKPEDIYCVGCLEEDGRHIGHCYKCEIRQCTKDKGIFNCAFCDEYGCEKITGLFKMAPEAKKTLDEIRATL